MCIQHISTSNKIHAFRNMMSILIALIAMIVTVNNSRLSSRPTLWCDDRYFPTVVLIQFRGSICLLKVDDQIYLYLCGHLVLSKLSYSKVAFRLILLCWQIGPGMSEVYNPRDPRTILPRKTTDKANNQALR